MNFLSFHFISFDLPTKVCVTNAFPLIHEAISYLLYSSTPYWSNFIFFNVTKWCGFGTTEREIPAQNAWLLWYGLKKNAEIIIFSFLSVHALLSSPPSVSSRIQTPPAPSCAKIQPPALGEQLNGAVGGGGVFGKMETDDCEIKFNHSGFSHGKKKTRRLNEH